MSETLTGCPWPKVAFGDVVRHVKDKVDPEESALERYIAGEHMDTDDLKIRRWGLIGDDDLGPAFHMRFKPGQVLYGSRRTYLRKVALADFQGITANTTFVLESKDSGVLLPELLPFIMQTESFHEHSIKQSKGSVNPYINFSDLVWYEFSLPPLEEQQRIAEVLQAAERERESVLRLRACSESVHRALANTVFSATKWPTRSLGAVLDHASDGPFGSKIKTQHYADSGVRVIRLQNIDVNEWNDEDRAFVPVDYFERVLRQYEVRPGDVVVAGLGDDSIPSGRACVVPVFVTPALNKADCYCLRPSGSLNSHFLSLFLNSPVGLRQARKFAQGTTRSRLNLANIKQMSVPLPSLGDQGQVVARLLSVWRAKQNLDKRIPAVETLRERLLSGLLGVRHGL